MCVYSAKMKVDHYLTDAQLDYFRSRLLKWRSELLNETNSTQSKLKGEKVVEADDLDTASNMSNQMLELRSKDRVRKLIHKIDKALARIDDGTYGYCEETGEPIGVKRLEARPIATLCISAQEQHEKNEREYRDDD